MFPRKLTMCTVPSNQEYPDQISTNGEITEEQLRRHINKLSLYKATGTDEILNIVIKKCTDSIIPYLIQIYHAV